MVRIISFILMFSLSFNAFAWLGGKNSFFNKPLGTGKRSVGANIKRATKAAKKVVKNVTREAGTAVNNTGKAVGKGVKDVVKTTAKAVDDTGKAVFQVTKVPTKVIGETANNVGREAMVLKSNIDQTLTTAYKDLRRESSRAISNIQREGGKGLEKVGAVLEQAGQPANILTIAVVYTASIYAGPAGAAFANSLMTKIKNPNVSDKELFNSFVIGAAAGYAAQGATNIPIESLQSMPNATSAIVRNLTTDVGNVILNGKEYSMEDFIASVGSGAVNINTGDDFVSEVIDSSLNASATYTVDRLAHKEKIDLDQFEMELYKGMATGLTRESVHGLMDKYIVPLIPEDHKGLDKKFFEAMADVIFEQHLSNEEKLIKKFESLDQEDQKEIMEELNQINEDFKEYLAKKLGKDVRFLTYEDLSNELSIKLHEEFVSLKLEERRDVFAKLELSKDELHSLGRSPQSGYFAKGLLYALTAYGHYLTIQEANRVEKAYKQFEKETGKSFEEFVKENPAEFKDLAMDAALAMLPGIGVLCKELKIGMKQGAKLVSSAAKLGLTAKDEIFDFAKFSSRILDDTGAVGNLNKSNLWTKGAKYNGVENAYSHWKKHGKTFPELNNAKEYVEKAKSFLGNPPLGTFSKTRPNGDKLFYNPAKNIFGVKTKEGLPKTMFKPKAGQDYWDRLLRKEGL